ncbi:hypothetical protein OIU34_22815 [Pararhizobium sp. BT-229]|uniref:hypothetical protein n=1 Tax=Pararhizobium sp. BT-229 TaxID=2986923 RepID=UPI0021F69EA7|nr:hypothetical protein [Pararhizobium sp. BT-229]MCV9964727.1 hypothetical protein [Pararhizobium sp. BT-229]
MPDLTADQTRESLLAELREFALEYDGLPDDAEVDHWYFQDHERLPGHDFNREIVNPGANTDAPEGCVRIMCDVDFCEVANLPSRFTALSCADVVSILWPDIKSPTVYPDHGDHWWIAIGDESLEVPGQPVELWLHFREGGAITETMRFEAVATEAEALEREARMESHITEGSEALFEIRVWKDGERVEGDLRPRSRVVCSPPREPIVWPWTVQGAREVAGDIESAPGG